MKIATLMVFSDGSPENNSLRKQHKNRCSCSEKKRLNTDRMASSPQAHCVTEKTKPTKLSSRRMKSQFLKPHSKAQSHSSGLPDVVRDHTGLTTGRALQELICG